MPKRSWRIFPGKIHLKIGEPIDASKYSEKDRERLMKTIRTVMIAQSLELGGKGGDPEDAIAARGVEGSNRNNLVADDDDDGLHTA